jgi:hypothetical protein
MLHAEPTEPMEQKEPTEPILNALNARNCRNDLLLAEYLRRSTQEDFRAWRVDRFLGVA